MANQPMDPAQAIADSIEVLQQRIAPKTDEIEKIRAKADSDIGAIEDSIEDVREEIARLKLAAAALRGELPRPRAAVASRPSGGGRRKRVSDHEVEEAALRLVREHEAGITSKDLAEALGISTQSANMKLNSLIEAGKLGTNGRERAQRRVVEA